jgi:predicted DCC family thiol-disulfide oxidoreductase YuxK
LVILYDDDCGFCRWLLTKILRWDRRRRLRVVALQDEEADVLLAGMSRESRIDSWHLVAEGRVYSAGAAVAPLMKALPGGWLPAALASMFPGITERLYRLLADRRDWLGAKLRLGPGSCRIERTGSGRESGTA